MAFFGLETPRIPAKKSLNATQSNAQLQAAVSAFKMAQNSNSKRTIFTLFVWLCATKLISIQFTANWSRVFQNYNKCGMWCIFNNGLNNYSNASSLWLWKFE